MVNPLDLVIRVGALPDQLGIDGVLGGSLASPLLGEPRSTLDIDMAVTIEHHHVPALVASTAVDFYIDEAAVTAAIERGSSFDLIHHATGVKIDVFVLTQDLLDRRRLARRLAVEIHPGTRIWIGSAEDQILRKLTWFPARGEASNRPWRDAVAIAKVQRGRLDVEDLHRVALAASHPLGPTTR